SNLTGIHEVAGKAVFWLQRRSDTGYVSTLYRTDGTAAGTVMVADNEPFSPSNVVEAGSAVYYYGASNGGYDGALYRLDTDSGSVKVTDGIASSYLTGVLNKIGSVGNNLYFSSSATAAGEEPFVIVNGGATPQLVSDLATRTLDASPQFFRTAGKYVYFIAGGNARDYSIWRTDGTSEGTIRLMNSGYYSDYGPEEWQTATVGDRFYFSIEGKIFRTDGTAAGTKQLASFNSSYYISALTAGDDYAFFAARDTNTSDDAVSLYTIDASDNVTSVSRLNENLWSAYSGDVLTLGNTAYFVTGDTNDREVWRVTPGSPAVRVADINPAGSSNPMGLTRFGGGLAFAATGSDGVRRLYRLAAGLSEPVAIPFIGQPAIKVSFSSGKTSRGQTAVAGGLLFFPALASDGKTYGLWRTDGTAEGTFQLTPTFALRDVTAADNRVFFVSDSHLWVSDGTVEGTKQLSTALLGQPPFASNYLRGPRNLISLGERLFFAAASTDGLTGVELYTSDGTAAGTKLYADVRPGQHSGLYNGYYAVQRPSDFAVLGRNTVLFMGNTVEYGSELFGVWDPPVASINGGPLTVNEGATLTLSGGMTTSPDVQAAKYEWDFNYDGSAFTADATGASARFDASGIDGTSTRTIALRVTDSRGATAVTTEFVTVNNVAPTALFGGSTVTAGKATTFTFGQISDPSEADYGKHKYSYDFNNDGDFADAGDVLSSDSPTASYTFPAAGTYMVGGRITDKDGGYTDYVTSVTVNPGAVAPVITNLGLNKPATASSSNATTRTAAMAFDGSTSTRWAATSSDPAPWLQVDLGQSVTLTGVTLNWEYGYAKGYKIQVSANGTTWSDLFVTTTGDGKADVITGLSGTGRYVRMLATVRGTAYAVSLYEMSVLGYASVSPPPPPPQTGSLSGVVFGDVDADGVLDSSEAGLGNRVVYIDANSNNALDAGEAQTLTNATTGAFTFTGLAAGTYRVRHVFAAGTAISTPLIDQIITAGQAVTGLLIGSKSMPVTPTDPKTAAIRGYAFNDTNKDGLQNGTETRAASKVVFLDTNNNGRVDTGEKQITTSTDGSFAFTSLAAGTYRVRRVFPTGYTYSTKLIDLTLAPSQSVTSVTIGSKTV
ncbi:MAG TPA: discoidin domain-containing protein, partial [Tepidisphaeraceae bacterium]